MSEIYTHVEINDVDASFEVEEKKKRLETVYVVTFGALSIEMDRHNLDSLNDALKEYYG